jgi:flavodoxin I
MYQVLYFSRGGHTKKVADAIAAELGVQAADIKQASLDQGAEVVFLGSGCYGGKPSPDMVKFIETSAFKGKKVGLFGTSAGGEGKEVKEMAEVLKGKGATVFGSYYCKGQFLFFVGRGHPNQSDMENARQFARNTAKKG